MGEIKSVSPILFPLYIKVFPKIMGEMEVILMPSTTVKDAYYDY